MSQDAEKSQVPVVGMEPGPQDLTANRLPQGSRSVYITIPSTYSSGLDSYTNRLPDISILIPETEAAYPH